jgi:MFS family permease
LRQSLDTVGAFLGPLLAILLMWLTADNFRAVFWIAVIPAFLALALIVFAVTEPEGKRGAGTPTMPLRRRELVRLGSAFWLVAAIAAAFTLARFSEAFLILRAQSQGLPIVLVPLVLVVMNIAYAASAYPAGVWSDRIERTTILIIGLAILVAADLILALWPGLTGVGIGIVLWGLHMGLTQGLLAALVADTAPPDLRGTAFGMYNVITGGSLLLASIIAGALWDVIGPEGTFLTGAGFAALAIAGLVAIQGRLVR